MLHASKADPSPLKTPPYRHATVETATNGHEQKAKAKTCDLKVTKPLRPFLTMADADQLAKELDPWWPNRQK